MKKILFAGGDDRSVVAYNELKTAGFDVTSAGLFPEDSGSFTDADIIILPVPSTRDGKTVNCPLTGRLFPLSDIEKSAGGKRVIAAGKSIGEDCTDILKLDSFAYMNAVPTAEGAISFAIDNTPFTLWGARVLIIGCGRVARVLKERLSGFGCRLTVSARKFRDFALLDTQNTEHINTADVAGKAGGFDIIFNTVDAMLFPSPEELGNALLIDLSSKGCTDFKAADELGVRAVKLPGLPGKTAPLTSGMIYAKTLISVIDSGI